jgi:hypothetical protein
VKNEVLTAERDTAIVKNEVLTAERDAAARQLEKAMKLLADHGISVSSLDE